MAYGGPYPGSTGASVGLGLIKRNGYEAAGVVFAEPRLVELKAIQRDRGVSRRIPLLPCAFAATPEPVRAAGEPGTVNSPARCLLSVIEPFALTNPLVAAVGLRAGLTFKVAGRKPRGTSLGSVAC